MRKSGQTFWAILNCLILVSEGQNVTYATSTYEASKRAFRFAVDVCTDSGLHDVQIVLCNQIIRFSNGKQLKFSNGEKLRGISPKEIIYDEFLR